MSTLTLPISQTQPEVKSDLGANWLKIAEQEILTAMQTEIGYDVTATSNVARFQSKVLLEIVRAACGTDTTRRLLLISHQDWFNAFLKRIGKDADEAPEFAKIALGMGQDQIVEYAPGQIIKSVKKGLKPRVALNVLVYWLNTPGSPEYYTFEDTLFQPNLLIRNNRHVTYRLLDFEDMIVYDEINGFYGRPTTGVLAWLLRFLGDAKIVQSRLIETEGHHLVAKTKAVKGLIKSNPVVTVLTDGKMQKGLNPEIKDQSQIAANLEQPIEIIYQQKIQIKP